MGGSRPRRPHDVVAVDEDLLASEVDHDVANCRALLPPAPDDEGAGGSRPRGQQGGARQLEDTTGAEKVRDGLGDRLDPAEQEVHDRELQPRPCAHAGHRQSESAVA
jgi:hypothetical protein